jgi:phosphoglycolate phosphatase-like HAD superfamily hydrolase
LLLHRGAGPRQYREIGAFVRYCVSRIERDVGEIDHWAVTVAPVAGEFSCVVAVVDGGEAVEATGRGLDGPLAVWEALCRLEQRLREARARRAEAAPDAGHCAHDTHRANAPCGIARPRSRRVWIAGDDARLGDGLRTTAGGR